MSRLLVNITAPKELEVPLSRRHNNCMMNEMRNEYENLVLEVRDAVADVSKEEDFEYNLDIYLENLRDDVIRLKDA